MIEPSPAPPAAKARAVWVVLGLLCSALGGLLSLAAPVEAQSAANPVAVSRLDCIEIVTPTTWRPGDASAWAAPQVDQDEWRRLDAESFPVDDWRGVGWLRVRVRVAESLHGVPVGLSLVQQGAAELWIDGERIHSFGVVGTSAATDVPDRTADPRPVVFRTETGTRTAQGSIEHPVTEHLVAIRYSSRHLGALRWSGVEPALALRFVELRPAVEARVDLVRKLTFHQMLLAGLALAFGLVHLMLFVFRPVAGPNLYFALMALSAAVNVYLSLGTFVQKDPETQLLVQRLQMVTFLALAVASIRFIYSISYPKAPRVFWLFVLAGLGLAGWSLVTPVLAQPWTYAFMLATNAESVRAVLSTWFDDQQPMKGGWILGVGAVPILVLSPYQLLASLDVVPTLWHFVDFPAPYYGLVALMFAMSVYLGRDFARTQRRLEREIVRVQRLSEEKLAQEQRVRQQEVERARLEAENDRRAAELEEARRLQVSMLPKTLPTTARYDIAVHFETATEVGGDYYDFLHEDGEEDGRDDALTIVVGDATGHGAQAGTVVAAAKAMLRTAGTTSPGPCLDRLSKGLRQMGLRRRHMALLTCRLDPSGEEALLSAAAMPPVFVYRAAEDEVVSVEFHSLPLGSFAGDDYEEKRLPLGPGDRLVLLTDGLPESVDAEGEAFGYDRLEDALRAHGTSEPTDLTERLVDAARTFTGHRDPGDDLTVVVVGVRGPESER